MSEFYIIYLRFVLMMGAFQLIGFAGIVWLFYQQDKRHRLRRTRDKLWPNGNWPKKYDYLSEDWLS